MPAELKITKLERCYRFKKREPCAWCKRRRVLHLVCIEHETASGCVRVSGYTEAPICAECESMMEVL